VALEVPRYKKTRERGGYILMQILAKATIFFGITLAGCNSPTPTPTPTPLPTTDVKIFDGQSINLVGQAIEIPDHANKSPGVGVLADHNEMLFAGEYRPVPAQVLGERIRVRGVLREKHLPMFHSIPGPGEVPQGIAVPPGTDIAKESIYYVIENPVWELVTP
jgi:hypothetical protein